MYSIFLLHVDMQVIVLSNWPAGSVSSGFSSWLIYNSVRQNFTDLNWESLFRYGSIYG